MLNNNKVTNNQILGYDNLHKILTKYRENSKSLTNDERLIAEHIEKAIKGPFEQDGLFCPFTLLPILNPARTRFNKEGSPRSQNLYERRMIFQWCYGTKMEDPCNREIVQKIEIDSDQAQEIEEKLPKYFYQYYDALSDDEKENIDIAMNNMKLTNLSKITKELISAVIENDLETVNRLLMNFGANVVNARNRQGDHILALAISLSHIGIVKSLLEHNADVNIRNKSGQTPLDIALEKGNVEMITLLKKELISAVIKGDLETVNRFLDHGADFNSTNKQGDNILVLAASQKHIEIVKSLLHHGATVDLQGSMGFTALRLAIGRGNLEIVDILLRNGANVNAIDRDGNTPLINAVRKGSLEIVEKLLSYRADLSIKNKSGQTPLDIAFEKDNVDMINLLTEAQRTAEAARITLLEETQKTAKPANAISEIITAAFQRFALCK